ncbi:CNNM domain-containing protein [Haloarcula salina]|uniref:Hemolysin family protein n=1 Tax=Haloarcula salina TaxID=1429914 RepID=A0AA41G3X3_9EURY|nr:hemolysin family protein [Haloarcula salina]MBV0903705.1 hemolysin family protein [Haloarcula salina]
MQTAQIAARLLAGLALILANGFFVAIEFALTRARQYSESEFDEPGLRRAWEMTDDLEIYLTSCQVGITASSIAVGIVAEPALAAIFEPYFQSSGLAGVGAGAAIAFLIINLVHLTHGEQTPTYLGVERAKFVCRYGATPLYYFAMLISPLIKVGDSVAKWTLGLFGVEMSGAWLEAEVDSFESRAELRNELGSVLERGDLSDERREEVLSAFRVGDRPVSEVMVPREDVVALSTTDDDEANATRIAETPHTRYPLVGEDFEDFLGIVYIPALVDEREEQDGSGGLLDGIDLEAIASPSMTLAADTSVSDAIDQFQAENQEVALVMQDGEVVGLVTVTDLLEEVVGDIQDPIDAEAGVE